MCKNHSNLSDNYYVITAKASLNAAADSWQSRVTERLEAKIVVDLGTHWHYFRRFRTNRPVVLFALPIWHKFRGYRACFVWCIGFPSQGRNISAASTVV